VVFGSTRSLLEMTFDYWQLLILDLAILGACAFLLIRRKRFSSLHPSLFFLGCHFYVVTLRLLAFCLGKEPIALFVPPLTYGEIARASIASEVGIVAMTAAWLMLPKKSTGGGHRPRYLPRQFATKIAIFVFLVGIVGLSLFGWSVSAPFVDFGAWKTSAYLTMTRSWPIWAMCILHFVHDFPRRMTIVTLFVMVAVGLNMARFGVIIPAIFLWLTWSTWKNDYAVGLRTVVIAVLLWLVWFPLKVVSSGVRNGQSFTAIRGETLNYFENRFSSKSGPGDTAFLDSMAAYMGLADQQNLVMWGATIAPILTSPVPRQVWPNKPVLNAYQRELSTAGRPMATYGMTAGLVGEAYVNLRFAGVFITCFLLAMGFGLMYQRVVGVRYPTSGRLIYFVLLSCVVQIYRDGLVSLVIFPLVYCSPAVILAIGNLLGKHQKTARYFDTNQRVVKRQMWRPVVRMTLR